MVKIIDYAVRTNRLGEPFCVLILQGGIELVKSQETGLFYVTDKRTSIASTLDEESCKEVIGQKLPGTIQKVQCDPYEYTVEKTGEVIELSHRWVFVKEGETLEEAIFEGEVMETAN